MTSRRPPSSVACLLAIAATLITTFQAIVLGALQGVSELFPISSLGHTVIFPHLFGWNNIVRWESQPESPWLAFIVMLHVGSAIGLLIYFWRDWVALVRAFFATLAKRRIETPTERLAWLIVVASLPVGLLGLAFEHTLRVATAKPEIASIFLVVNGVMLLGAERLRRRAAVRELAREQGLNADGARRLETLSFREAAVIGLGGGGGGHRALPDPVLQAREPDPVWDLLPAVRDGNGRLQLIALISWRRPSDHRALTAACW
jgi:undecaprenyl pyrophosphate phosphatase UppP